MPTCFRSHWRDRDVWRRSIAEFAASCHGTRERARTCGRSKPVRSGRPQRPRVGLRNVIRHHVRRIMESPADEQHGPALSLCSARSVSAFARRRRPSDPERSWDQPRTATSRGVAGVTRFGLIVKWS